MYATLGHRAIDRKTKVVQLVRPKDQYKHLTAWQAVTLQHMKTKVVQHVPRFNIHDMSRTVKFFYSFKFLYCLFHSLEYSWVFQTVRRTTFFSPQPSPILQTTLFGGKNLFSTPPKLGPTEMFPGVNKILFCAPKIVFGPWKQNVS